MVFLVAFALSGGEFELHGIIIIPPIYLLSIIPTLASLYF
jgi:hypothetical protein